VSLAERRRLRLFTLCALYVAQGIPWGFMATTLPANLTKRGVDFGIVTAALSFTTLPYAFKWVWGPIIDSFALPLIGTRFGRRRPWIVLAQGLMALTVIALIALDLTTRDAGRRRRVRSGQPDAKIVSLDGLVFPPFDRFETLFEADVFHDKRLLSEHPELVEIDGAC